MPQRYFTPAEVAAHNCEEDLWLSFLGNVYDLTPLAKEYTGSLLLKPLVADAGKDVSHWFNPTTGDVSGARGCGGARGEKTALGPVSL
jgi:cytochrome b involved in lipid metabolism